MNTFLGFLAIGFLGLFVAISIAAIAKKRKWPIAFSTGREFNLVNPKESEKFIH